MHSKLQENMMSFLTHAQARQMAESKWGSGGTHSEKTTEPGAFYFSCSGHGGFILDGRALPGQARESLKQFIQPEIVEHYFTQCGKLVAFNWPDRRRNRKIPADCYKVQFEVFVLEEDCDWCLAYMFTPVRFKQEQGDAMGKAKETFWNWFDTNNPKVRARKAADRAREEKDPNLIISAIQIGNNVQVITADGAEYLVSNYQDARDEFGYPWLNRCTVV